MFQLEFLYTLIIYIYIHFLHILIFHFNREMYTINYLSSVAPAFSPTMRSMNLEGEYPLNSHLHTLNMFLRACSLFGLLQRGVPSSSMGIFLICFSLLSKVLRV